MLGMNNFTQTTIPEIVFFVLSHLHSFASLTARIKIYLENSFWGRRRSRSRANSLRAGIAHMRVGIDHSRAGIAHWRAGIAHLRAGIAHW
jgi:hypothetical protein